MSNAPLEPRRGISRLIPWPHHAAPAGAAAPQPSRTPPEEFGNVELDTAKAVADLAAKEYAEENSRRKDLDTKLGVLTGATGAGVIFVAGIIEKLIEPGRFPAFTAGGALVWASALALVAFLVAEVILISAMKSRTYQRFELDKWVTWEYLEKPANIFYSELAATYKDASVYNTEGNDCKARRLTAGVVVLAIGVILLVAGILLQLLLLL